MLQLTIVDVCLPQVLLNGLQRWTRFTSPWEPPQSNVRTSSANTCLTFARFAKNPCGIFATCCTSSAFSTLRSCSPRKAPKCSFPEYFSPTNPHSPPQSTHFLFTSYLCKAEQYWEFSEPSFVTCGDADIHDFVDWKSSSASRAACRCFHPTLQCLLVYLSATTPTHEFPRLLSMPKLQLVVRLPSQRR